MINLNDEKYNANDISVFNNGVAGIVENVTIVVEKKTADDKENAPDYKLVCTDETGASCNMGIYYPSASQYNTEEKAVEKMAKGLKHLITVFNLQPNSYPDGKSMLDGVMNMLRTEVKGKKVRMIATYGNTTNPKGFIQPRGLNWVPWIESMDVPLSESILKVGVNDNLVRLTADATSGGNGSPSTSEEDGW